MVRPENSYSEQRKIRKIVSSSSGKEKDQVHGITVPRLIAERFEGVYFRCYVLGNTIHFESGAKIERGTK